MKIYIDFSEDGSDADEWHELHDCTCPICLGPAEHRILSNGYEDIECMQGCSIVWLRGEPTDPDYVILLTAIVPSSADYSRSDTTAGY